MPLVIAQKSIYLLFIIGKADDIQETLNWSKSIFYEVIWIYNSLKKSRKLQRKKNLKNRKNLFYFLIHWLFMKSNMKYVTKLFLKKILKASRRKCTSFFLNSLKKPIIVNWIQDFLFSWVFSRRFSWQSFVVHCRHFKCLDLHGNFLLLSAKHNFNTKITS